MARKKSKGSKNGDASEKQAPEVPTSPSSSSSPSPYELYKARQRQRTKAASEESRFAKLGPTALENMSLIATYTDLQRPIKAEIAFLDSDRVKEDDDVFTLPKKPRWRHDMTTKEVQSNEESVFTNWLWDIDEARQGKLGNYDLFTKPIPVSKLPRPHPQECLLPSLFERNVQVYRQLWRVMDRSDILLVLVDARCPLLHLPTSLEQHLRRFARKKVLIVLTKKDIVGEEVAAAWKKYLEKKYDWAVVATESYAKRERLEGQGSRTRYTPYLSVESREALIEKLQVVHQELVTPHPNVQGDPERLRAWEPPCSPTVDWQSLRNNADSDTREVSDASTSKPLTIGLIGQPNVGKSSLLNALIGSKVVRASRTPGKTKTFQTHYLGGGVQLCDCPGLVFPNDNVGQELQVLGAVLPISQVQAVSTVVRFVASHIPLEEILRLEFPPNDDTTNVPIEPGEKAQWTATRILEALCRRHGYKTAKAGRWDLNRAGNALLRTVAEGRIPWAFRPPDTDLQSIKDGKGIWLGDGDSGNEVHTQTVISIEDDDEEDEDEDDARVSRTKGQPASNAAKGSHVLEADGSELSEEDDDEDDEDEEEDDESEDAALPAVKAKSMFDALAVEDANDDDEDDDEEEDSGADRHTED